MAVTRTAEVRVLIERDYSDNYNPPAFRVAEITGGKEKEPNSSRLSDNEAIWESVKASGTDSFFDQNDPPSWGDRYILVGYMEWWHTSTTDGEDWDENFVITSIEESMELVCKDPVNHEIHDLRVLAWNTAQRLALVYDSDTLPLKFITAVQRIECYGVFVEMQANNYEKTINALKRFGHHSAGCASGSVGQWMHAETDTCNCGLSKVIRGEL